MVDCVHKPWKHEKEEYLDAEGDSIREGFYFYGDSTHIMSIVFFKSNKDGSWNVQTHYMSDRLDPERARDYFPLQSSYQMLKREIQDIRKVADFIESKLEQLTKTQAEDSAMGE